MNNNNPFYENKRSHQLRNGGNKSLIYDFLHEWATGTKSLFKLVTAWCIVHGNCLVVQDCGPTTYVSTNSANIQLS